MRLTQEFKRSVYETFYTLVLMLFLAGCVESTSQISSGLYTSSEPGSEEKVEVKGSEIVFHIKINGTFLDRQFDSHSLWPNGTILFLPISSNEYHYLQSRYNWTYDGKVIWKEEIETRKKISFIKEK